MPELGKYAFTVWAAYGVCLFGLAVMTVLVLLRAHQTRKLLAAAEKRQVLRAKTAQAEDEVPYPSTIFPSTKEQH